MYKIDRTSGKVVITDLKGHVIYSVSEDSIILYKSPMQGVTTSKVKAMTDEQLLEALANAIKLDL